MVKIKYTSCVKVIVNTDGSSTQLIFDDKIAKEAWKSKEKKHSSDNSPSILQQQDIEKQLSVLTDHFDSKLENLNNLILKELTEKINKIEKSVIKIGQLHDALLIKIAKLEHIVSQMKNEHDINVHLQEIKDLKQQISILQAKVSAIQEQKKLLISRMTDFDAVKLQIHEMVKDTYKVSNNLNTFEIKNEKTEDLVVLMSNLTTANQHTPQIVKKTIDRIPGRNKKRGLPKNAIGRSKFTQFKNTFLKAMRYNAYKQHKGQEI